MIHARTLSASIGMIVLVVCVDATAQVTSSDPLRHGHALLIGNFHYSDSRWTHLDDVPLQISQLHDALGPHFDSVERAMDLDSNHLKERLSDFMTKYGNTVEGRLLVYYAGHGYTEIVGTENRGYVTGTDTPVVDGSQGSYDAARAKALSMERIRAFARDAIARQVLFIFDSCFSGTIFTNRTYIQAHNMTPDEVRQLLRSPARFFISAGSGSEIVPAHSPLPSLLIAAIHGEADRYGTGVVSGTEIGIFLKEMIRREHLKLTPQAGPLNDPDYEEGDFLFRVVQPVPPTGVPVPPTGVRNECSVNYENRPLSCLPGNDPCKAPVEQRPLYCLEQTR